MADEKRGLPGDEMEGDAQNTSDSGLGNLPPLSDFDSGSGLTSDSGLPPLSSFESGGLPPLGDIDVETPNPTGGNIRSGLTTPSHYSSGSTPPLDTPGPVRSGFQDMAADSDFSPETPEIGPGPDSDVDTPMFDSAFGGGDAGFDASVDTPAPTQAMETPMFGGGAPPLQRGGLGGGAGAFDPGTFGGGFDAGTFGGGGGTPMPDFSPDTNLGGGAFGGGGIGGAAMGAPAPPPAPAPKRAASPAVLAGVGIAALVVGILAGPYIGAYLPFLPSPLAGQLSDAQAKLKIEQDRSASLQKQVNDLRTAAPDGGPVTVTPQALEELTRQVTEAQQKLTQTEASIQEKSDELRGIEDDIATTSEEFIQAREQYEDLNNELSIMTARQTGLIAEVDRLSELVGGLEEANQRRIEVKQSLAAAANRLYAQVREGLPLTPEKYSHDSRVAAVEALRQRIDQSPYITPELQSAYTDLYVRELEIAGTREYFYAKLPVTDRFGSGIDKWAECVMVGNWGVYYRTLDGRNIGVFEDIGDGPTTVWSFRQDLPENVQRTIESEIIALRPADWESKVAVLAEKQISMDPRTELQRNFDSL